VKLFRLQLLILSVFIFVGWAVMQQPTANAGQGAQSTPEASVTPQKGQSAEQQKKDLAECYKIAKEKTGIDPWAIPGLSKSVPGLGEAGDAAQNAASGGDTAAGTTGAKQPSAAPSSPGAQSGESKQAKLNKFEVANQACLQGRGYLVKGQAPAAAPASEQPK
jgi:hypothetical protein